MQRSVSVVLALVMSGAVLLADSNNAMLYATGAVAVNGVAANRSAALFPGDKVQTAAQSGGTITTPGSTIVLAPNSSLVYEGKALELAAGVVEVNTTRGMGAHAAYFTVAPAANQTAKFQVASKDGKITVAAERGAVVLSDGNDSVVVQEGTTQTADQQVTPASKKDKKKAGGMVPPSAASQGVGGASKTLLVGAALVGLGVGTAAALATTGPPASPSRP
jgi:hypothetical protein